MAKLRLLSCLLLLALAAGCPQDLSARDGGPNEDVDELPVVRDAGPPKDSGPSGLDAGPTTDAGNEPDDELPPALCGNDRIEPPERCDGLDLEGRTCRDLGFAAGEVTCKDTCADFNVEGCAPLAATAIAAPGSTLSLSGSLEVDDPRWERPSEGCEPSGSQGHLFDAFAIVNTGSVLRQVNISAAFEGNGFLHVMRMPFKPQQPGPGCLAGNDDLQGDANASGIVELPIPAGATVVIVVSSYEAEDPIGGYDLEVATLSDDVDVAVCGNGEVEAGELCDGSALGGASCASQGFASGTLSCASGCLSFDESGCSTDAVTPTATPIAAAGGQIALAGAIETSSPRWDRPYASCAPRNGSADRYYEAQAIVNETGSAQVVRVQAEWEDDGFLHAYSAPFDPTSPESGCLAGNDDFEGDLYASRIDEVAIAPGETLVLVASAFLGDDPIGPYILTVRTLEAAVCGNDDRETGEVCDGSDLEGDACLFRGFDGGRLTCGADCGSFVERDCFDFEPVRSIASPGGTVELAGVLQGSDPRYARPTESCGSSGNAPDRHFDAWLIRNETGSAQVVDVAATWGGDGFLLAYTAAFDSVSPTLGCLDGDDDEGSDQSRSTLTELEIAAGETLVVVTTTFASEDPIGAYTLEVSTLQGAVCGDASIDGDEQCDGDNLAGATCSSRGMDGGHLSCGACLFEERDCFSYASTTSIAPPGDVVELSGSLQSSDPRWDRPTSSCGGSAGAIDHPFDAYRVRNDTGSPQLITVLVDWTGGGDGFLHAYTDAFDSAAPRDAACLAGNDDRQTGDRSQSELVDLEIAAGETLVLVPSSFAGGQYPGAYGISVETKVQGQPPATPIGPRGTTVVVSGSLESSDARWDRVTTSCGVTGGPANRYYDVHRIVNQTGETQDLTLTANWLEGDGFLVLAIGSFDAANPTAAGCLAADDDFALSGPALAGSRIESDEDASDDVYILPGETLQVIASAYAADAAIGEYSIDVRTAVTSASPPVSASLPSSGAFLSSGTLHTIDARWNRPDQCAAPVDGEPADHYVDVHYVKNNLASQRNVRVTATWLDDPNGYLQVYSTSSFDPAAPSGLCVASDDGFGQSVAEDYILPGETLAIVASGYFGDDAIGRYEIEVESLP